MAFVSRRLSIKWGTATKSEPTHTVVLTAAESGCFIDTRFLQESPASIDWAFAGYRVASEYQITLTFTRSPPLSRSKLRQIHTSYRLTHPRKYIQQHLNWY